MNIPKKTDFTVTKKAMRPASKEEKCFYCQQPLGAKHNDGCVLIQKKVKVRAVIEYEIDVPSEWDASMIEFHRNESSWCAGNMIDELQELNDKENECICGLVKYEHIEDVGELYLDED